MGGGGLVEVDGADADGGLERRALLGREKYGNGVEAGGGDMAERRGRR